MMNVAEWMFSGVLVLMIISFATGYVVGYSRHRNKTFTQLYKNNEARYLYDRDGDTSQCK